MAVKYLPTVDTCCYSISVKAGCYLIAAFMIVYGLVSVLALVLDSDINTLADKYIHNSTRMTCAFDHTDLAHYYANYMEGVNGTLFVVCGILLLVGLYTLLKCFLKATVYMEIFLIIHNFIIQILIIVACFNGEPEPWTVAFHFVAILASIILWMYFLIVVNSFLEDDDD